MADPDTELRLGRWRTVTLATLLVGYAGYYLCRSNLSVSATDIERDGTLSLKAVGVVMSVGTGFYTAGKLINGLVADVTSGRWVFLFGMLGSIICTVIFGLGTGIAVLAVAWAANRFVQSMGWPALIKVAGRWFPPPGRATALGALSISYLVGDAAAKLLLGGCVKPLGWRGVFLLSAGLLGILALVVALTLRGGPGELGLPEIEEPGTAKDAEAEGEGPSRLWHLLAVVMGKKSFWLICLISCGLTLIREALNSWVPTYLEKEVGIAQGWAGMASAVAPLAGALGALAGGALSDYQKGRHARVMLPSVVLMVAVLGLMSVTLLKDRAVLALILVGCASFFLIMAYAFCAGVMAIDLGGRRASATASGLVDGAGYLAAIFSGYGIAWIATGYGWRSALGVLAAVGAATAVAIALYAWQAPGTPPKTEES
jgi:OPA family glycerol-3-phosphate transporter-like MFS transporter